MSRPQTAAALVIGNEILSGKIREANVYELSRVLRELGVVLKRVVVIPDEIETIASVVRELSEGYDHVFTSGGVGSTHDDVTMAGIAEAFGATIVRDPTIARLVEDHYGDAATDHHFLLANVPRGAHQLTVGKSPWPLTRFKNIWILPGIPEIFRMKLRVVREHLGAAATPFVTRAVYVNLEEPDLKTMLDATVAAHPDVEIGSYPKWNDPEYKTKVTFDAQDAEAVERALNDFRRRVPGARLK